MAEFKAKRMKGLELTKEEKMEDAERQLKRRSNRIYPNSLGVTGEVFRTGKLVYANEIKKLQSFLPSIDNLSSNVKDVRSLLILPIFGHRDPDTQNSKPIAVF